MFRAAITDGGTTHGRHHRSQAGCVLSTYNETRVLGRCQGVHVDPAW